MLVHGFLQFPTKLSACGIVYIRTQLCIPLVNPWEWLQGNNRESKMLSSLTETRSGSTGLRLVHLHLMCWTV